MLVLGNVEHSSLGLHSEQRMGASVCPHVTLFLSA